LMESGSDESTMSSGRASNRWGRWPSTLHPILCRCPRQRRKHQPESVSSSWLICHRRHRYLTMATIPRFPDNHGAWPAAREAKGSLDDKRQSG
jgi:hypothetical protein